LPTFNCECSFRLGSSQRISGHAHIDTCVLRVCVADLKSNLAGLGVERGLDVVGEHEWDELVGILRGAAKPLNLRGWLRLADAGERDLLAVHGLHLGEKRRQKNRRTVLANAERCVGLEFDPGLADGGQRSGLIQSLHHVEAFVGCYGQKQNVRVRMKEITQTAHQPSRTFVRDVPNAYLKDARLVIIIQ